MKTNLKNLLLFLAIFAFLYMSKHQKEYVYEIDQLNQQIKDLKNGRPEIHMNSCLRAVDRTCFYADCAITSIETIKEKVCKPMEEQ